MFEQKKEVSIVIAALNEQVLIKDMVLETIKSAAAGLTKFELILVNDCSTDRTGDIMDQLAAEHSNITVIHNAVNKGFGAALHIGLQLAKYEYFMVLCGDGGLPGESLPPIFAQIGKADVIIPYMGNLRQIKTTPRFYLSRAYTTILNIIFRQKLHYYNGLPVYRARHLKQLKIVSTGFAFQAEIITKLLKSGCSYIEVKAIGAERSHRSTALKLKNFYEVGKTTLNLIWEVSVFTPIRDPHDLKGEA